MTDVEMKDAEQQTEAPKEKTPEEIEALIYSGNPTPFLPFLNFSVDLQTYTNLVKRTAETKEMRHLSRALRYTFASLRRKITPSLLTKAFKEFLQNQQFETLQAFLKDEV